MVQEPAPALLRRKADSRITTVAGSFAEIEPIEAGAVHDWFEAPSGNGLGWIGDGRVFAIHFILPPWAATALIALQAFEAAGDRGYQ